MFIERIESFTSELPGFPEFRKLLYSKGAAVYSSNEAMDTVHQRFLKYLRELIHPPSEKLPSATGGIPFVWGISSHVSRHLRDSDCKQIWDKIASILILKFTEVPITLQSRFPRHFVEMDIEKAYDAVDISLLAEIFLNFAAEWEGDSLEYIKQFFERFCSPGEGKGLVRGAPSSSYLFNIYTEVLVDRRMHQLCKNLGLFYTRYIDDMLFSSDELIGKKKRRQLRAIVRAAGFILNEDRSRVIDLEKGPAVITGVGIELPNRMFMPRRQARKLKGMLHLAQGGHLEDRVWAGLYGYFNIVTALTCKRIDRQIHDLVIKRWQEYF